MLLKLKSIAFLFNYDLFLQYSGDVYFGFISLISLSACPHLSMI